MSNFREIFSRNPERMTIRVKRFFGLPLAYIIYLCFSLLVPSFDTLNNSILIRAALLEFLLICSLLLVEKYFLNFKIKKLFTRHSGFRFGLMTTSLAVMMFFNSATSFLLYLIHPNDFEFTFVKAGFIANWLWVFVLIVFAAVAEELIFRSYIAFFIKDEIETETKSVLVYCFVSGLLFSFFHFRNPEVSGSKAFWAMGFYFIFGLALMFFFLKTEGIEMPLGLHIGNNLVASLIFSYDDSVIKTDALFTHHNNTGIWVVVQALISLFFCCLLYKSIIRKKEK